MEKPVVADKQPIKVSLKKGEDYYWCSCGRSANQPFCDGSHAGTAFVPKKFTAKEDGDAYLCLCKYTVNPPHCDGSHADLPEEEEQAPAPVSAGPRSTPEEPTLEFIHELAGHGLERVGHHGEVGAMGVPRPLLPQWEDIQILTAQLHKQPLMEDAEVGTELIIGPRAKKPLRLEIPLLVSDMSFGALSEEAKVSLARGAELAGTGICSGEGGMLPEEQAANSRYFYELASAQFGYKEELLTRVQAFHFKGGQGAKTGTGGHLPGNKVTGKIAQVRRLPEGRPAISPPTFRDLHTVEDFKKFADRVREITGGIPIGFKLSAQHIEKDIAFAVEAGADYIILDGRGGGTGAAPLLFRDNISVPTIPALARARRFLDNNGHQDMTLIITGGLRTPADFVKALALGADGVALSNAAMQAIGCIAARICNTNNCPAGIATQNPELRKKLDTEEAPKKLARFFEASVELMKLLARACGHSHLNRFSRDDLTTWKKEMAELSGIDYAGSSPVPPERF
ncbi:MAG: glutamate synthase [Nitrospinaceae bacterium]|nr:glutamate synthase [Nitrospinaceae bacterium]NIR57488.1 glutamate synthase [Nitrospinaceae bacterium]NIS87958.1 glutamate synthase [Nitrospinaceae bacterium]NIT84823.1 glutamate synthase [Nitrospinaceae bacterium]NIU47003.1 glutamate synthase [Nitrospinaceae bacterium]